MIKLIFIFPLIFNTIDTILLKIYQWIILYEKLIKFSFFY
jgi:hypothetical protein